MDTSVNLVIDQTRASILSGDFSIPRTHLHIRASG